MKGYRKAIESGVALVVVLGMTVILLGLAVAFLAIVRSDRTISQSYSATIGTRNLADTAVQLVQSQILAATTQGSDIAWTSQPGLIRTFSNAEGGPGLKAFRLYSAERMIIDAPVGTVIADQADVPATWQGDEALWTDLNAPVLVPSTVNPGDTAPVFPILDPAALSGVEGFQIDASKAPTGTVAPSAGPERRLPMPVRWLYVLREGNIVAPTGSGVEATVTEASPDNPIVGRIAFWTDDETCKVNINTASDGMHWDTPRTDTNEDRELAKFQPAQREFQRYPGHPATTSLAPVLFATSESSTPELTQAQRDALFRIVPRVNTGGSDGGRSVAAGPVALDSGRLYANVDELIFSDSRTAQEPTAGVTREKLERSRFFLTATSRAPELTLFNTPRVLLWPLDLNPAPMNRTAFDRLIAFCTTINGFPYYFTRSDPKSSSFDYDGIPRNREMYRYLKELTSLPVPGFGSTLSAKFGSANRDQLLTQIFDYVRSTNLNDSGLSAAANRFGERGRFGSNQIPYGANQVAPIRIGTTQGFGRFPIITEIGMHFICTARTDNPGTSGTDESAGSNVVSNKTLGGTLLSGSERRVEAMFFFETFIPSLSNPPISESFAVRVVGLNGFTLNGQPLGFPADDTDLSFLTRQQTIHGRAYGGAGSQRSILQGNPSDPNTQSRLPARGIMPADAGVNAVNRYPFVSAPVTIDAASGTMSFSGGTITLEVYPRYQETFPGFTGATTPVQQLTIRFEGGTFPIPDLVSAGTPASGSFAIATDKENWWTFSLDGAIAGKKGRLQGWSRTPSPYSGSSILLGDPFHPNDVVRSMVPAQNDYRLLAVGLSPGAAATSFVKHPLFDNPTVKLAHAVSENYIANAIRGRSVRSEGYPGTGSGVTYPVSPPAIGARSLPDVPIVDADASTGDWDNGMAFYADGAFINRPDEGNIHNIAAQTPYFDSSEQYGIVDQTFFSPNRQIPSSGMLGSLPSQAADGVPFQTLLFRPQANHFGEGSPPDHIIADLFWMPVVEPYAISEPFSTAGKINMNYAIVPFGHYLTRSTGIVALLRSERIIAIPNLQAETYKLGATPASRADRFRLPIDAHETLKQFSDRFTSGNVFRSASEIMTLHLVPVGRTVADMPSFWNEHQLTGDNSRERPYTTLLGRLTTKSNVFTIHYRVQSLKKVAGTPATLWDENRDKVLGEIRGSTVVERYISPNDSSIIDYATTTYPLTREQDLGLKYKWRTLSVETFAP